MLMLQDIHTKLKNFDAVDLAIEVLEGMDEFLSDLNREQLAKDGVGDDGSPLKPDYEPTTMDIKSRKSGLSGVIDHITLYDTGDLHNSITAAIFPDEIIMDSEDPKVGKLEEKYGSFLGLTDKNIKIAAKEFNTRYIKRLNELLF